jgi:hypothetical protein
MTCAFSRCPKWTKEGCFRTLYLQASISTGYQLSREIRVDSVTWLRYVAQCTYLISSGQSYGTVKRVKQSHYKPGQDLSVQEAVAAIFRDSWYIKVVRLSALCTGRLYPQEILVLISVRGCVDSRAIVRSEGVCQWKIPKTLSGIEPATFRFVAQYLNQCATISGPPVQYSTVAIFLQLLYKCTVCNRQTIWLSELQTASLYQPQNKK